MAACFQCHVTPSHRFCESAVLLRRIFLSGSAGVSFLLYCLDDSKLFLDVLHAFMLRELQTYLVHVRRSMAKFALIPLLVASVGAKFENCLITGTWVGNSH